MIELLITIVVSYIGLGILSGAVEVKFATGKDTWDNLWKHKRMFFKHILGWSYYSVRTFLPKK